MTLDLTDFRRQYAIQMEPDEIEYITSIIHEAPDDALMVEWGSGASTVKWLTEMRGTQRLIAIEHNRKWHAIVKEVTDQSLRFRLMFQYHLCEPNGQWDHGYGWPREENPVGLDDYFCPNDAIFDADIFLIDGVARGVCAINLLHRARKPNPIILLHDWYKRQLWYSWAVDQYQSVERVGTTLVKLGRRNDSSAEVSKMESSNVGE